MKATAITAWISFSVLLALVQLPFGAAAPNCPLIGPEFPPPQRLAEHPIWKGALDNITAEFDYIDASTIMNVDDFSYSIQVFSTNPGEPILWERHHTARDLPVDTAGVKKVDGDTVYRLGSVSKLFAVLAFLVQAGDVNWNQPITMFIPELARYSGQCTLYEIDSVRETAWDDVTIGALASQVSGLGRDYGVLGEITQTEDAPFPWQVGFTTLSESSKPPCGAWPLCTRQEFFEGLRIMYPSYPPWQTATYSDVAYQLLAYALESISGRRFVDILNDRIIKPLSLNRTYYEGAPASVGIVPGTVEDMYWSVSLGDASPGGNMYSSASDLSTLGCAILSSKLIKPSLTRRWLNPVTFSADFLASVGAPWGIRRIQLAKDTQPHRTLSTFTKAGTFRKYTAFITLLRDFNIGFTIMMAGDPTLSNFQIADLLGESLIPAYDAVARDEADKLYSGIYVSLDSVIIITTDPEKPGLGVGPWISNGTDMVEMALKLQAGSSSKSFVAGVLAEVRAETRLYYTQLESKSSNGGKRQSWKAVFENTSGPGAGQRLFSTSCAAWVGVTGVTYDSLPLDEFVFNFDSTGKVVSVENLALRSTLYKVSF
ncbi:beta-lactamase family protein-like protein [Melanomma pulvis-pyrius CBS 109.77]|uniref:Beta-lactamase family protein-like protein n=1 Tax=Melanomma pulvis-pyrius CBS 109.77 TaxID=1314802 RepID=A0A6A6XUV2_9PLEO|nr:beta-lactamase family protein-like protein [Melanomma pulvis-pyrius CBS 109.77]